MLPPAGLKVAGGIELNTRLVREGEERPTEPQTGRATLTQGRFDSAIVAGSEDAESMAFVGALRKSAGLKPTTILIKPQSLPTTVEGYEALDSIFLCTGELELDPLRRGALVQFLERGGRVWIMLSESGFAWAPALLGDRWDLTALDAVEATKFVIKSAGGSTQQEFDHGVRLLRVCAPSFEATHTIDANPAALRKFVGRGQLIVTTLSPRGWLDRGGAATPALSELQSFVTPGDDKRLISPADMRIFDQHVQRAIGYRILERGSVVPVFAAALVVIMATAMWTSRRRRLELVAPASAVCALACGAVLIGLGRARQTQTSSTVATDQFIQVAANSSQAEALARSSVYITPGDDAAKTSVKSTGGGYTIADRTGSGQMERMVWSDSASCELQGLDLRPGAALSLTTHSIVTLPSPLHATISADDSGVRGRLELGGVAASDAPLLVTASGVIPLQLSGDGTLRGGEGDTAAWGAFASGTLMSEEQISRQRVCRELLGRGWAPSQPSLLLWSEPLDLGMLFPVPQKGSSLLVIPLTFVPPAASARVLIPSPLLSPEPVRRSFEGRASAVIYDPVKRTWLGDIQQPKFVMMEFQVPDAFAGIVVDGATLRLDMRAPGFRFEVVVVRGGRLRTVGSGANPAGRVVLNIEGDDAPEMDSEGRVLIGVDIKGSEQESEGRGWSIQRMDLSIRGSTR
ncbi:MAG: hypothetical protein JSR77_15915 [Planctomycetes bacterium]|nr:hypothetical protein [Planctomycetota bacterium]